MSKIASLIKQLMNEKGITQTDLSKLTGITQSSISDYITGKYNPKQDKIDLISKALGVRPSIFYGISSSYEIVNKNNVILADNPVRHRAYKGLPIVGIIAAGTPILVEQNIESYFKIDSSIKADFILKVKGDSMINIGIHTGDLAFINKQDMVEDGEIAAVLIDDEATLKRFYRQNGTVTLIAENSNIPPRTFTTGDIHILGKLIAVLNII